MSNVFRDKRPVSCLVFWFSLGLLLGQCSVLAIVVEDMENVVNRPGPGYEPQRLFKIDSGLLLAHIQEKGVFQVVD